MAFISMNRTANVTLADSITAISGRIADAYAQRKVYNTTYHELQNLSNRELADLGIHRSHIKSIALEAARK